MARLARIVVPVRARLVQSAADWPWSSARAHLAGRDDGVVKVAPVLERIGDFAAYLDEPIDEAETFGPLRLSETTGRPLGTDSWLRRVEAALGRSVTPKKRGRKPADGNDAKSKLSP